MKKLLIILALLMILFIPVVSHAVATTSSMFAKNKIYILYTDTCQKCAKERKLLEKKYEDDNSVNIEYININENKELVKKIKKNLKINNDKLPITIIGTTYFTGFNNIIMNKLTKAVSLYDKNDYCDIVTCINNKADINKCLKNNEGIYKDTKTYLIFGIIPIVLLICLIIFIINKTKIKSN